MAAALLSIVDRKDFDMSIFDEWFKGLIAEYEKLSTAPDINTAAYVSVRTQANVLAHLAAKVASQKNNEVPRDFCDTLNATLSQID